MVIFSIYLLTFVIKTEVTVIIVLNSGKRSSKFPHQAFVGPDWPCLTFTYLLIIVPSFFFLFDVGTRVGSWVIVIGTLLCISSLIAFSFAACSDPGIVFEYLSDLEVRLL